MTLAEKHYRATFRIKPEVKLTNDQWKIVNMMHRCLQEYNKPKLPHGKILVEKKHLIEHLKNVKQCLTTMDKIMLDPANKQFSNSTAGKQLGKCWSFLNNNLQSIAHYELKIPLERVNEEIKTI